MLLLPALVAADAAAQTKPVLASKVYSPSDGKSVFNGLTHTNYPIEMHVTELEPGKAPHPPHHHPNEEVLMLHEGTLDVMIAGQHFSAGPGSVVYVASGEEHGWKNAGDTRAKYWVIALGPKA